VTRLLEALAFTLLLAPVAGWLSPLHGAIASRPDTLADSTVVEHWTLDNGLRVVTRHIPNAGAISITVGYPIGGDQDPGDREGLAQLLGELIFTSAAGDVPDRTRKEMDSQRPLGWSYPVTRRSTLFTEIASVEQFPGVLSQVAARMRGVTITEAGLRDAIRSVRREMAEQVFGAPGISLGFKVREVGIDRSDEAMVRRGSAKDLDRLTVKEAQQHVQRLYVPANATLGLTGELGKLDVHTLVRNLFDGIPPGTALLPSRPNALKPHSRTILRNDLDEAAGVVGIIAPAVDDSLHPSFLLNAMLLGSHFNQGWQKPGAVATTRYHYSLFDEQDLVRVYPSVHAKETKPEALATSMSLAMEALRGMVVTRDVYDQLRSSMTWLMGGPMTSDLRRRIVTDTAGLHTLSRSMAACSMWGGTEFWADYRRRFESLNPGGLDSWVRYFAAPEHQIRLLLVARK